MSVINTSEVPALTKASALEAVLDTRLVAGALVLLAIIIAHSPHWWIFATPMPGSFEWTRAFSYLQQCEQPFRTDVEPAMLWRFLPQLPIYLLGGSAALALAMPWIGSWFLLSTLYALFRDKGNARLESYCMSLIAGCTAPVLVSTGWLGMNDSWVALGLCYLAFGRNAWLLALVCLCCPFIDERFVFGTPAALMIRNIELLGSKPLRGLGLAVLHTLLALSPFIAIRLGAMALGKSSDASNSYLINSIRDSRPYLHMTPLALWMAWRLAALVAGLHLWNFLKAKRVAGALVFAATALPIGIGFLLATDIERTAGIAIPLVVWCIFSTASNLDKRIWLFLAIVTLIIPAMHITGTKIAPINSLPVELLRLRQ